MASKSVFVITIIIIIIIIRWPGRSSGSQRPPRLPPSDLYSPGIQTHIQCNAVAWLCSLLLIPPPLHSHRTLTLPQAQVCPPEESHDQWDQSEPVQELHQRERGEFSSLHPGCFGFFRWLLNLSCQPAFSFVAHQFCPPLHS